MLLSGALLMSTGCVRAVWFTQPLRETYEIGVVASPMGGDALAEADPQDPAEFDADPASDAPEEGADLAPEGPAEDAPEGMTDDAEDVPEGMTDDATEDAADPSNPPDEIAPQELPARSPDQLQYFVSERLVLQREATSRDGAVAQGRLKVRRGRFVEQVVVRRRTPGIAVDWGDDWVAVSFEADSAIVFGLDDTQGAIDSDVYHLRARRDPEGGPTTVTMRGEQYEVRSGHGARLMVRRDSRTKRERRRRVMRGRTLEDGAK